MVYVFIGQDSYSKDITLQKIKEEFIPKGMEDFNQDILYAKELTLIGLQEKLLCLPLEAKKRLIVIRSAQELRKDIQEFILKYVKNPNPKIVLVLDIERKDQKEKGQFIDQIAKFTRIHRFKESVRLDTFTLSRQIELHKADYALYVLNQLLRNGEKPERILGGLRYAGEKDVTNPLQIKKRIKLILSCDIDIKTGRLKPVFALERLVVNLCCLNKSSG